MMKRISGHQRKIIASLLLFCMTICLFRFPVYAENEWDDTIYRAYCEEGQLTQEDINSLDESACTFVRTWKTDMVLVVTNSTGYSGNFEDAVIRFYENNSFGYGPDRDGVICGYDEDSKEVIIRAFGAAKDIFPQSFIDENEAYLPKFYENHGNYGVLYAFYLVAEDFLENPSGDASVGDKSADAVTEEDTPDFERGAYGLPIRDRTGEKPTWYPEDPADFKEYHDSEVSRVVDFADIFSDEDEQKMKEKIADIVDKTGKDIVIFTDTNTYGFTREIYCYDFYDFCGYGFGNTYDGMCLFVCMDPNNRGWVASATGVVEDMYSEDIANEMDDQLYEYMAAGYYADGVLDWIGNMYNLYTEGYPFVAEWLPKVSERDSFVRTNNANTNRLYDPDGLVNGERVDVLKNRIRKIADKYGIDVAVNTTKHTYGMSDVDYADAYYYYNGLGFGENYDGILLTIINDYNKRAVITAYGAGLDKLTELNYERLHSQAQSDVEGGYFFSATDTFLKNVEHMEKTGRVNHTFGEWFIRILIACGAGALVGGIALYRASAKMKTVHSAYDADAYLDGLHNIIPVCDTFVDEHVTKTKIVRVSSSSDSRSSGSSSRSSYHSHSSGSSGRSHTSSSRNF